MIGRVELAQAGVYLLLGAHPCTGGPAVYIGEAEARADRLRQHREKDLTLEARAGELERENAALRQENALLRERLGLNSSNSNKPPSSDGPAATPPAARPLRPSPHF